MKQILYKSISSAYACNRSGPVAAIVRELRQTAQGVALSRLCYILSGYFFPEEEKNEAVEIKSASFQASNEAFLVLNVAFEAKNVPFLTSNEAFQARNEAFETSNVAFLASNVPFETKNEAFLTSNEAF